jgi:hypothetical protein
MTDEQKQVEINFMHAQRLAIKIGEGLNGEQVGVIAITLAILTADFCASSGQDPHLGLDQIARRSHDFIDQILERRRGEVQLSVN